jgi:hypothetical protein
MKVRNVQIDYRLTYRLGEKIVANGAGWIPKIHTDNGSNPNLDHLRRGTYFGIMLGKHGLKLAHLFRIRKLKKIDMSAPECAVRQRHKGSVSWL